MATWMVHLRIADKLLDQIPNLLQTEFIVGNIAPDSGIPNEDWSVFTPSGDISHFKTTDTDGLKDIHINEYVERYFTLEQKKQYDGKQTSFYLGYLTHLLTDMMWANQIVRPGIYKFKELFEKDRTKGIWTMKEDWYDLDFLFLKKYPDFRAFSIYENAVGFENEYLDFFSVGAFDNRREYITGFYREEKEGLEREYPYLNENDMNCFVDSNAEKLVRILREVYLPDTLLDR